MTRWVKDWDIYNFEISYHHGGKDWELEVYNYRSNFLQARSYFPTFEAAKEALKMFGYHNVVRFLDD